MIIYTTPKTYHLKNVIIELLVSILIVLIFWKVSLYYNWHIHYIEIAFIYPLHLLIQLFKKLYNKTLYQITFNTSRRLVVANFSSPLGKEEEITIPFISCRVYIDKKKALFTKKISTKIEFFKNKVPMFELSATKYGFSENTLSEMSDTLEKMTHLSNS